MTYNQFISIIIEEKNKYCVPNIFYSLDNHKVGYIIEYNDINVIPVKDKWNEINNKEVFENNSSNGKDYYVIYSMKEPLPFTFVLISVDKDDNKIYYDSYGQIMDDKKKIEFLEKLPERIRYI